MKSTVVSEKKMADRRKCGHKWFIGCDGETERKVINAKADGEFEAKEAGNPHGSVRHPFSQHA